MSGKEMKEHVDPPRFAQILRQCADVLEHGITTEISIGGQSFTLETPEDLEVEYEAKKNKQELEMKIVWRNAA